jgi:hypothetical protein
MKEFKQECLLPAVSAALFLLRLSTTSPFNLSKFFFNPFNLIFFVLQLLQGLFSYTLLLYSTTDNKFLPQAW